MKFILFEVYYRVFYIIGAISIIECFSYFVLGHQLEFFSGLLAFNYQAVDFDSYGDLRRSGLCTSLLFDLKQDDFFLLSENNKERAENSENYKILLKQDPRLFNLNLPAGKDPLVIKDYLKEAIKGAESCRLDAQCNYFLALSANEGRTWFYLFIVYLSYFYCLEVDKTTLSNVLMHLKRIYYCILIIIHIYSICTPGLFKKWTANYFFILIAVVLVLLLSPFAVFILITSFEELELERLDSELL